MKILITGATGLIGRNLIKELSGEIIITSRNIDDLINLQKQYPHILTINGDITDEKIAKVAQEVDTIYHLAALRAIGKAEENIEDCVDTNILGTLNLLKNFKGKKFITLSTDKAVKINSVYGASKFIVERLVAKYAKLNPHISYSIVVSGNVFDSKDSVISVWKNALINKQPITVTDLKATRYFCTIDEVINALLMCDNTNSIQYPKMKAIVMKDLLFAMQVKYGDAVKINTIGKQLEENLHEKIHKHDKGSQHAERYTIQQILNLI